MKTWPFLTAGRDHQPDIPAKFATSCKALWRVQEHGLRIKTSGSNFLTCTPQPHILEDTNYKEGMTQCVQVQVIQPWSAYKRSFDQAKIFTTCRIYDVNDYEFRMIILCCKCLDSIRAHQWWFSTNFIRKPDTCHAWRYQEIDISNWD